jgi:hypothetical protein
MQSTGGGNPRGADAIIAALVTDTSRWRRVAHAALVLPVVVLLLPTVAMRSFASGLDPSVYVSLTLAVEQGLVFGRDVVFTFGPLGFLLYRIPPRGLEWMLPVSDLLLLTNVLYLLVLAARRVPGLGPLALGLAAMALMSRSMYFIDAPFVWMTIAAYHALGYLEDRRPAGLAIVSGVSLVLFFLKLNLGLLVLPLVLALLVYAAASAGTRRLWLALPLYLAALMASAWALHVDLVRYIRASWHIVNGFNDAMYMPVETAHTGPSLQAALIILCAFLAGGALSLLVVWRDWRRVARLGLTTLFVYVLFKQGFVRADHAPTFFALICLPLWLAFVFPAGSRQVAGGVLLGGIVISCVMQPRWSPDIFQDQLAAVPAYARAWGDGRPAGRTPPDARLSAELTAALQGETVDVIPWDTSVVFFNQLRYNPRPVFQTYSAYDAYLDGLNRAKLESASAPSVLLFENACIDRRYCVFDESLTKRAMLANYDPVEGASDRFIVLKRRATPRVLTVTPLGAGRATVGQFIDVPDAPKSLAIAYVDVRYSVSGAIMRLLFQPPALTVWLRLAGGEVRGFKCIVPILGTGVLINKYVASQDQAQLLFSRAWTSLRDIEQVAFDSPDTWGFQPEIRYRFERLDDQPAVIRATAFANVGGSTAGYR